MPDDRRSSVGEPLEFEVPALDGRTVHRAGPDVALDDRDRFEAHAVAAPPFGWLVGWIAHPDTLGGLFRGGRPGTVWSPPGVGVLIDRPVWASASAPVGVLVPVHVLLRTTGG